jgi:coenzyme F420 biosynthesis associated uncharacterized protein
VSTYTVADIPHWGLLSSAAERTMPTGPLVPPGEANKAVRDLRRYAVSAAHHVKELTQLDAGNALPAVIVDRAGWVESNAIGMQHVINFVQKESSFLDPLGDRAGAIQAGLALGWASGKVLGQYEAFTQPGRLLLVAPNIVKTEKALKVNPRDFRMWVCLHEETHRVQFGAVPWMQQYFLDLIAEFVQASRLPTQDMVVRVAQIVFALARRSDTSILELVQSNEQKAVYFKISALMTLLEGHADYIMDLGGPRLIPSVATIREGFEAKRDQNKGFVSHLLGMNEKLDQYRNGAIFVRESVQHLGMSGFNHVWDSPESLPTLTEIANPSEWRTRISKTLQLKTLQ